MREAELRRLVSEISLADSRERLTDRALLTLGRRLTAWGRRLEENHAPQPEPAFAGQADDFDYLKFFAAPSPAQGPAQMVAFDRSGAEHKHMNIYSHSHRG